MTASGLPVLIPMASPGRAKGRLASILDGEQRRLLALTTLRTVVEAVRGAGLRAVVLTPEPGALGSLPAEILAERAGGPGGLNGVLEVALASLGPPEAVVILHADLPLVSGEDVRRLVKALPEGKEGVVLVRSSDGGTNAMYARPPGRFPLSYGPRSFAAHAAAAFAAGLPVKAIVSPRLALDLDTPADVRTLLSSSGGRESPAGRLLLAWGLSPAAG